MPATGGVSSAEGRRNYTDLQETSQWLGGLEIPKVILGDLLSGNLLSAQKVSTLSFMCFKRLNNSQPVFALLIVQ